MPAASQMMASHLRGRQMPARLPAYDALLRAAHIAFAYEYRQSIGMLPLGRDGRVLDLACGDGFFSEMLARRLGERGSLTAYDLRPGYLDRARRRLAFFRRATVRPQLHFVLGNAYRLPFDDCSFDGTWCCQSFISLDDPVLALRELARVTVKNGHVAILECDEFHHLLLPWPLDLEFGVARAIRKANRSRYGDESKTAVAREVPAMFAEVGLRLVNMKTLCGDRWTPFDRRVRRFLHYWFDALVDRVTSRLWHSERDALKEFIDSSMPNSLWRRPNAELTWLSTVYIGQRT
jgi:ubiquinone/menaquinone biosynthesis C-methylase UbiE